MLQVTILNPVTGCCSRLKQKSHTLTWWSVSDIFWAVDRGHCPRNGIWNDDMCQVILSQCQLLVALLWRWRITKGKRKRTLTGSAERCVPCQLPVCVVLKGVCLASVCCAERYLPCLCVLCSQASRGAQPVGAPSSQRAGWHQDQNCGVWLQCLPLCGHHWGWESLHLGSVCPCIWILWLHVWH